MVITLKAIEKSTWSGFFRFPRCKDSLIVNRNRSGYETGLTVEEEQDLEKKLALPTGTLGRYSKFWEDFVIYIPSTGITLDLEFPKDLLDYKVMMASPRIANSEEDIENNPSAEYVLIDESQKAKVENKKVKLQKKAMLKFGKMSIQEMKSVLKLKGIKPDNSSDEMVENAIAEFVHDAPDEFIEIVEMPNFELRVFVTDLLNAKILMRKGPQVYYGSIDNIIGNTFEEAVEYLQPDGVHQDLYLTLDKKLKASKK